jgi:hypothetical protein
MHYGDTRSNINAASYTHTAVSTYPISTTNNLIPMKKKHIAEGAFFRAGLLLALVAFGAAAGSIVSGALLSFIRPRRGSERFSKNAYVCRARSLSASD